MAQLERYKLEDLLDIPRLQELLDSLNDVLPFRSAIVDNEGTVRAATARQDVCTRFHRDDPVCELKRHKSDLAAVGPSAPADPSVVRRCPHGLANAATPIMVGDLHLGNVFVGPFLLGPPDLSTFRAQAVEYGFDEDAYLTAMARVAVLTQAQLDGYLAVVRKLVAVLGAMALERLEDRETCERAEEAGELGRQIIAGAQEGIIIADRDMRITVWNPFAERLTGVSKDEVLGRRASEIFPFLGPVGVLEMYEESLMGRTCGPVDFFFEIPQSGRSAWVSTTTAPLRTATGEIAGVIGMVPDITHRRQVEESLRENEHRLFRAQSIAHVGNWELDLQSGTIWASPEAFRIYGLERSTQTLPLKEVQDAVLPEYRQHLDEALLLAAEGKSEYDVEFAIRRADDGQVRVVHSMGELVRAADGSPTSVLGAIQDVTELKAAERDAIDAAARLRLTVDGAVNAMSAVVESRDPYTAGHQRRVTQLAMALAAELGIEGTPLETLRLAAELHDVGKVAVPAEILTKPGRLSATEFAIVKVHSAAGAEILAPVEFGAPVADIVRWHHERLDGSGYPDGLVGEAIPREARIIAVADAVEAMASHRPYRPALGIEAVLAEIGENAGRLFDADVVLACERVFAAGFAFNE